MKIRLRLPDRFSFDAVVRSHGWYDLPPFSYDDARGTLKTVVGSGELVFRSRAGWLEVSSKAVAPEAMRATARRVFSLDLDLSEASPALSGEPVLSRGLARGGGRMLRAPTLFEDAVKMLLTTNCSWAATRGMVERLIALAGEGGRSFPVPRAVARLTPGTLRAKVRCGYRAEALSRLARRIDSGKLDLSSWERREAAAEDVREAILEEHGFGPYAAEGLLRILGRHDFLALDSWVRKKYRQIHPGPTKTVDRAIARRYARFGEYQGLALWLELTQDWHEKREQIWP
jgi:N-glycosylase/DNA lyase